jgi:glycosyltransferase involved in cell wall biosynthesis
VGLPAGSIWLSALGAQSSTSTGRGIARYIVDHALAVVERAPGAVGSIRFSPALPFPEAFRSLDGSGLVAIRANEEPPAPPAVFHVMSPFEGIYGYKNIAGLGFEDLWPPFARQKNVCTVVTLHDLIPMVMHEHYLDGRSFETATYTARLGLIRAAQQVLTNSERTAADALEYLGIPEERITVIGSGVSNELSSLVASRAKAERFLREAVPKIRSRFLLYVGGDDYRKNIEGLIRAYGLLSPELRGNFQLVIVCKMLWARRMDLKQYARSRGIRGRDLVLTGFVPDRVLAALYRSCELFVFPSLYEGAGLPILEAMSFGAPVAASATSSIPEILGDLEATFAPNDPAVIAACLSRVLTSPSELEALQRRSRERFPLFTWDRVADRTLEGYERALSLAARPRRAQPGAGL